MSDFQLLPLKQHDVVIATFSPTRTDDLKPGVMQMIGSRLEWSAGWCIEDGPYKGQQAMIPCADPWFAWVPECDLTDIELLSRLAIVAELEGQANG
mgnify:CR=1 FL=1